MTARTGRWTTDLLVTLVVTVLATGAVLVGVDGSPLGTALVVPLVVFLPGYALVSALFPEAWDGERSASDGPVAPPGTVGGGVSPLARVGLAVALSIALLPAAVLGFAVGDGAIRIGASYRLVAGLTVILTIVALLRRYRLPPADRFTVPTAARVLDGVGRPFSASERNLSESSVSVPTSKRGVALNVVLAVSVVAFASSVAVAYAYPTQGQQFTELYLVTQSNDGEFVASNYPHDFDVGQSRPVYATIANHEGEQTDYTLVVTLQQVDRTTNGTGNRTVVTEQRELTRLSRTVEAGQTVRIRHDLRPTVGGGRLRVQYLLYRGSAPANPSAETAYRSVHLWITVGGESGGA